MDRKDEMFTEQDAPQKNTDHAFVKVGSDGSPVMPLQENTRQEQEQKDLQNKNENKSPA